MNRKIRVWTIEDASELRTLALNGKNVLEIAADLDRTLGAIIAKMFELGITPVKKAPRGS